ncbi:hypothetical protein [Halobaculum gomorrense]|uniref:Uncharacterized protein n=1 Tax=Halobaculum gomorrense TaxID=43928 RepID=A0A1M5UF93_9EURY|nr:hypothetical protein [Halobaculum gomorrense]SHH61712.1 hypothetical protein SAMN05443636_3017 [Halobaculum gomorrense]
MNVRETFTLSFLTDLLRNPEYTGENRCFPCTLVNLSIGTAASVVVAAVSPLAGGSLFGLSLLVIYLRGYLVPGTPTVTKRYLPDSFLRLFDKVDEPSTPPALDDVDTIEAFLRRRDALREVEDGADLELTPSFRTAHRKWAAEYDATDRLLAAPASLLFHGADVDVDAEDLTLTQGPNAFVLRSEDRPLARWESRAAMIGDVAAAAVFADRTDDWAAIDPETRLQVLGALRLWYDRCPACGGDVSLEQDVVESCCRSTSVLVGTCNDCGSRMFETNYDDSIASE